MRSQAELERCQHARHRETSSHVPLDPVSISCPEPETANPFTNRVDLLTGSRWCGGGVVLRQVQRPQSPVREALPHH